MKKIILLLLFLFTFLYQSIIAQTADEIFKKSIEATGGKERIASVNTLCAIGSIKDTVGIGGEIKKTIVKGELDRLDFIFLGRFGFRLKMKNKETQKYECWELLPFEMKKPRRTPGISTEELNRSVQIFEKVRLNNKGDLIAELNGIDTIAGKAQYKIKLLMADSTEMIKWFDMETFLLTQQQTLRKLTDTGYSKMDNYPLCILSNYREVSGIKLPFTVTYVYSNNGKKAEEAYFFNTITINEPVDPKLFQIKKLKEL